MKDTPTRVFALMCVLVVVWTTVYWLYEPGEPPVTLDQSRGAPDAPAPTGGPLVELTPPFQAPEQRPQSLPRAASEAPKATPPIEQPRTRVIPPEFYEYTVQHGDTLETIAKRLLGDGRLWTKIAESNGLRDPNKLVPGKTTLRIPKDPGNIQGKEVAVTPRSSPQPEKKATPEPAKQTPLSAAPPAATSPASAAQEYVVKNGDTLSSIAKAFYGKSSLWRTIYEANQGAIDDPDHVKPGVTIKIPRQN